MYEETLKRKPLRGFKTFLIIIILVYLVLALMLLVGWVQVYLNISYLQYILLAGVILLVTAIVRRLTTRYIYTMEEDKITIRRGAGNKQKLLYNFPLRDIVHFGKIDEVSPFLKSKKIRGFLFKITRQNAFYIVLATDAVVLDPTAVFVQKLKEVYEKTNC